MKFFVYGQCILVLWGCAGTHQQEVLESKLRQREDQIRSLKSTVDQTQNELRKTREQLAYLQEDEVKAAACILPEHAQSLFSVQSVKIDPLHTGFVVQDELDNSKLNVVVTPFDDAGEIIRVPGRIEIVVSDSAQDTPSKIGQWNFDLHETAESWQRGFFISGFQFFLPVTCQEHRTISLTTTFTTTDNRVFMATHQVKCTDLLAPMPVKPEGRIEQPVEPARLETSVNWEKDTSPVYR